MADHDDVTMGELARSLELLRTTSTEEIRALRTEIRSLMGSFVPVSRYEPEQASIRADLADIKGAIAAGQERQERLRLAIFTSIAAPLIVAVILAVVLVQGT